ncbi:MAG: hypothetical protein PHI48_03720 [Bacteroidales bacterium]|nr:hypothetical protein [Bacteroidales bacterium]
MNRRQQMRKSFICSFSGLVLGIALLLTSGCSHSEKDVISWPAGKLDKEQVQKLKGFFDQKKTLLAAVGMSDEEFISFSTDSAWSLNEADRNKLKQLRNRLSAPTGSTLLQKIVALQDVATYMNNTYGGTVGGFVSVAADVKSLSTMHDVYWGMRLDYPGTKFLPEGAGYAVLRFTSSRTEMLNVPYCVEMGGSYAHAWPNTGGGFTSSSLGKGGVPEYTFSNYFAPDQGAELYEVTTLGYEILRATYKGTKWVTTEPSTRASKSAPKEGSLVRNGIYGWVENNYYPLMSYLGGNKKIQIAENDVREYWGTEYYISSQADYLGKNCRVWNGDADHYFLTYVGEGASALPGFERVEKNVFGKLVPVREISNFREVISIHELFLNN